MKRASNLFSAAFVIGALYAATFTLPAEAGPVTALAGKPVAVRTPDGLTISAHEWGNPVGLEIIFIHGFSQSHLSWIKQVTSDLAKDFHMVTYDLRGHGSSDKPLQPERYKDSQAWGDELQAVMDATGLNRPVLVGWSYGGLIIADYLKTHGAALKLDRIMPRLVNVLWHPSAFFRIAPIASLPQIHVFQSAYGSGERNLAGACVMLARPFHSTMALRLLLRSMFE